MRIEGEVVHGDAIGRTLGFPTANIHMYDDTVPDGVWAARVSLRDGRCVPAVVSIGRRPTFCDTDATRLLEAHLIDFADSLYGQWAVVDLIGFIRDQVRFASIRELIDAMDADLISARALTGGQASGEGVRVSEGQGRGAAVPHWALRRVRDAAQATTPGLGLGSADGTPEGRSVTGQIVTGQAATGGTATGRSATGESMTGESVTGLSRRLGMSRRLVRRCLRELDRRRSAALPDS